MLLNLCLDVLSLCNRNVYTLIPDIVKELCVSSLIV